MIRIVRNYKHPFPPALRKSVVAMGNFDGVHLGHQHVIETAHTLAKQYGTHTTILTFEPHPAAIFKPDITHFRITPFRLKMQYLAHYGVEVAFVLPFSPDFARMSAESFVRDIVAGVLCARHVVIGYDFIFGHQRQGNASYLREQAPRYGFDVTQVDVATDQEEIYASTRIRGLLQEGDIETATRFLGHPFTITGRVTHGEGLGSRVLQVPTANLALHPSWCLPAFGVYTVSALVDDTYFPAIANIGTRPTVQGQDPRLEVHLLDYSGDLYGKRLDVVFHTRLRSERAFSSLEALKEQIFSDCADARTYFASSAHQRSHMAR